MSDLIPQDFIDDLVQRVDIIEVISNRIEIKKAGREYKGLCPFHTEKTPSFTVSQEKDIALCILCLLSLSQFDY
jgi:DNA primase